MSIMCGMFGCCNFKLHIVEKIFELFWRDARLSFLSKRGFSMPAKFPKVSMRNLE